jgi:hypothetical protein
MTAMLKDVVEVRALSGRRLWLHFEDGATGVVDVAKLVPFDGVFAPLADEAFFARVRIHDETRSVCWPNEADLDTDVLYAAATGTPLPSFGR